jgi:hypothetical protein
MMGEPAKGMGRVIIMVAIAIVVGLIIFKIVDEFALKNIMKKS